MFEYGPIVWHVTIEVYGVKLTRNCFTRDEFYTTIEAFVMNEIPFEATWSKDAKQE